MLTSMRRVFDKALLASIVWALCVPFAACSSSSSHGGDGGTPSNCGKVAPCGGDIVGAWKVIDACPTGSGTVPNCPGATVKVSSIRVTGTVEFNMDKTYSDTLTESLSETLTLPNSCLMALGVTCAEQAAILMNGTTCTTSGSDCVCTIKPNQTTMVTGTYTLAGNTVTTTSNASPTSASSTGSADYCVQGSLLHLISTPMGGGAGQEIVAMKE
jgi:hypothetical protein